MAKRTAFNTRAPGKRASKAKDLSRPSKKPVKKTTVGRLAVNVKIADLPAMRKFFKEYEAYADDVQRRLAAAERQLELQAPALERMNQQIAFLADAWDKTGKVATPPAQA